MNFKNIKTRLLFWYSIIIAIILFIFSSVLLGQFYQQNIKTVDKQLITVINEINYNEHFHTVFDSNEFMIKNLYITIYKYKDGNFIKLISKNSNPNIKNFKILKKSTFQIFTAKNNIRVIRFHSNKNDDNIYIEVASTLNDKIEPSLIHLKNILITLIPMLLLLSIIAGYLIIKNSLTPVKKTIDEVKDIELHKLEKRIKSYTSKDEIEELVMTFNFLLDKLDDSFSKIKRFSNDVSHELKTPLTVIRGEIELGLRKERSNEEYKNILESTLEETKSLQELINSLLFLSQTNDENIIHKFKTVELDEIITDVISFNKKLIKEKSVQFEFKEFDSVKCQGNPILLKILFGNLIENAIKYSHNNSKIEIYLNKDVFKIKDYGIGIKGSDINNIFDRFYRIDASRARGGYGLGLSIANSIVKIHNFKIEVESEFNKYTEFTVIISNK